MATPITKLMPLVSDTIITTSQSIFKKALRMILMILMLLDSIPLLMMKTSRLEMIRKMRIHTQLTCTDLVDITLT